MRTAPPHPVDALLAQQIGDHCQRVKPDDLTPAHNTTGTEALIILQAVQPTQFYYARVWPGPARSIVFKQLDEQIQPTTDLASQQGFILGFDSCYCPTRAWSPLCLPIHYYADIDFDRLKILSIFRKSIRQSPQAFCANPLAALRRMGVV
jgi:hypothetical protein